MQLELDRGDLSVDSKEVSCSKTKFGDFRPEVQAAVRLVGKATFYDDKGTPNETYNVIFPPRQ